MTPADPHCRARSAATATRSANLRTAWILGSVALTFFVGVIAAKFMGGYEVGMSIVGVAVLLFLALAIGRNLLGR